MRIPIALVLSALTNLALGQTVYKCLGQDGKPVYQQTVCPGTAGSELKLNSQETNEDGGLRAGERDLLEKSRQGMRLNNAIDDAEWVKDQLGGRIKTERTRKKTRTVTKPIDYDDR